MRTLAIFAALTFPAFVRADGFIESIAPPVVEVGKTTRVTFTGTKLDGALGVWHSLNAGAITATPLESTANRAVFDVTVQPSCPVGVCGVRVATKHGLSNAHLMLVEDLPIQPRNASDSAMSLPADAAVWGTLREATVHRYSIAATAGQRVSFEVVGNRFGKDCDPLVTIRDAIGTFVAERDNNPGLYFDSRFEHTFEKAGTYTIEVRDARFHGNEHHYYVLRVGRFPAGQVAVPAALERGFWTEVKLPEVPDASFQRGASRIEPTGPKFVSLKRPEDRGSTWVPVSVVDAAITVAEPFDPARDHALSQAASPAAVAGFQLSPLKADPFLALDRHLVHGRFQATPAVVPGVLCGVLRTPGRPEAFRFNLAKGQRIFVCGEAKSLNSPADLEVSITDRFGKELRRTGETRDEVNFDFTAPATGDYGLVVRDVQRDGSPAHAYRITVRNTLFLPSFTAQVEGLTIPKNSYQPVPILVVRNGTSGAIPLHLVDSPPGLRLVPDSIPDGVNEIVCRLEADSSAPVGLHSVQIVANCGSKYATVRTLPLIDRKLHNIDLIPIALRDDQRRVPPSLADRFAVQIAPPAPFTFDLAEAAITLPRYQTADIPILTTRIDGFDGPITFTATGGQLADKSEGRTRVYAEFPQATREKPNVSGTIVSKILSNLGKVRTEVTASGTHNGRRVNLIRSFDLDLVTAFKVTTTTPKLSLRPGEKATVMLHVSRVKSFDGLVELRLQPMPGLILPVSATIPKGADSVAIDITVSPEAQARKQNLQVLATGDVSGFEEEVRSQPVEIEVHK